MNASCPEVYGSLPEGDGYFYETTPYDPHSPYSASKASSDFLVKAYIEGIYPYGEKKGNNPLNNNPEQLSLF